MRKSSFYMTAVCGLIFGILFVIPVFLNPNTISVFEVYWSLFHPFISVSERIEIDILEQVVHILPLFGMTFATVALFTTDYEKTQYYIFTRTGSKTKWLFKKYKLVCVHSMIYVTIFIIICLITSLLIGSRDIDIFTAYDFFIVVVQSYVSYLLLGAFLSLLCGVLALLVKETYALASIWLFFLIISSQLYVIFLNLKAEHIFNFFPLSATYQFFQPIQSDFFEKYHYFLILFEVKEYHLWVPFAFIIVGIGFTLLLGYFIIHRQKYLVKIRRNYHVSGRY